jgi:integrase/recombinase XerD
MKASLRTGCGTPLGSHAIDRGASVPKVQATLGHGNISTTSGYLHARPDGSSGPRLDEGVFLR